MVRNQAENRRIVDALDPAVASGAPAERKGFLPANPQIRDDLAQLVKRLVGVHE
jgi:hypothetical protein